MGQIKNGTNKTTKGSANNRNGTTKHTHHAGHLNTAIMLVGTSDGADKNHFHIATSQQISVEQNTDQATHWERNITSQSTLSGFLFSIETWCAADQTKKNLRDSKVASSILFLVQLCDNQPTDQENRNGCIQLMRNNPPTPPQINRRVQKRMKWTTKNRTKNTNNTTDRSLCSIIKHRAPQTPTTTTIKDRAAQSTSNVKEGNVKEASTPRKKWWLNSKEASTPRKKWWLNSKQCMGCLLLDKWMWPSAMYGCPWQTSWTEWPEQTSEGWIVD